jgi:hypothetical protein
VYAKWTINTYTVSFNSNGGSAVGSINNVNHGSTISAPGAPTKTGTVKNDFRGWYKETALTNQWNFASDTVTSNTTLYAKWDFPYDLGSTGPGGGIVFYQSETGFTMTDTSVICHYLEAAPADQSTGAEWGALNQIISGVTQFSATSDPLASTIGNGRNDTQLIVTHLGGIPETGRAAQLCKNYSGGGKTDWFLPSCGELNQLYLNKAFVGIGSGEYFSSSRTGNNTYVWGQNFLDGTRDGNLRNGIYCTRAIRAF